MVQTSSPVNGNITDLKNKHSTHSPPAHPQRWELKVRVKPLSPVSHRKGELNSGLWSPCCSAGLLLAEMRLCNGNRTQRARETLGCREEEQVEALLPLSGLPYTSPQPKPLQPPVLNKLLSPSYMLKLSANVFNKYFGPNHVPSPDGK